MKSFLIIESYDIEDTNFQCDYMEKRLIDKETNKIIMSGDYYHNKISDRILGFFKGLDYCGIEHEETVKMINENW